MEKVPAVKVKLDGLGFPAREEAAEKEALLRGKPSRDPTLTVRLAGTLVVIRLLNHNLPFGATHRADCPPACQPGLGTTRMELETNVKLYPLPRRPITSIELPTWSETVTSTGLAAPVLVALIP